MEGEGSSAEEPVVQDEQYEPPQHSESCENSVSTHQPQTEEKTEEKAMNIRKRMLLLVGKVEQKMAHADNVKNARAASALLKELRIYIHIDEENKVFLMKSTFVEKLVSLLPRCLEHRVLISDAMRCITPFMRTPGMKNECCELLCRYQVIKFLLICLRRHIEDDNISIQSTEMVYAIIDYSCNAGLDISALVNFMIMHGGVTILPQLLLTFESKQLETSLKKMIACKLTS